MTMKGTTVAAGTGKVVIVEPGIGGIRGVLLAADEVCGSIGVRLEVCAKSQNK